MEKKKPCDGDCDNCDLPENLIEIISDAFKNKRPMMQVTQIEDGIASILLAGSHDDVVRLIFNAIRSDERIEDIFMHVMSMQAEYFVKEKMGIDMNELKEKFFTEILPKSESFPKPKGEC
jgi:hypothetical protein